MWGVYATPASMLFRRVLEFNRTDHCTINIVVCSHSGITAPRVHVAICIRLNPCGTVYVHMTNQQLEVINPTTHAD